MLEVLKRKGSDGLLHGAEGAQLGPRFGGQCRPYQRRRGRAGGGQLFMGDEVVAHVFRPAPHCSAEPPRGQLLPGTHSPETRGTQMRPCFPVTLLVFTQVTLSSCHVPGTVLGVVEGYKRGGLSHRCSEVWFSTYARHLTNYEICPYSVHCL